MNFDVTITAREVQELSNADAVTAFFARLGWHTDIRIEQFPGNLGITAEGTVKPIKKIELIADQDGALQVYVFALTSVTIANTRAIVRAFRERAGNYLLVLRVHTTGLISFWLKSTFRLDLPGAALGCL